MLLVVFASLLVVGAMWLAMVDGAGPDPSEIPTAWEIATIRVIGFGFGVGLFLVL